MWAFKDNAPGRFSSITNFHCYKGQDSYRHGVYDEAPNWKSLDPSVPGSFDKVIGARDAIDQCAKLALFFKSNTEWENGVKKFLNEEVFALSASATGSNTETDKSLGNIP